MKSYHFAGYRGIKFPLSSRTVLKEVAKLLTHYEEEIVIKWVNQQFSAWKPPGFNFEMLKRIFGKLFHSMLVNMEEGKLNDFIKELEEIGADLSSQNFPYEALIISFHFLEESYFPFLDKAGEDKIQIYFHRMDEFLHTALAALATAYFQAYRKVLLDKAEIGQIIQEGLLPNVPKKILDLEIGYVYLSARKDAQIGGDFFDFLALNPEKIAFIIGDLSGHGLEAASRSIMLRSLFRGFMRENPNIAETMQRLNKISKLELEYDQFATALIGVYEGSGRLKLVNAGHPPPILCGNKCQLFKFHDIVLGINEKINYSLNEIKLNPGDFFIAYTDGLVEVSKTKDLFSEHRIIKAISEIDRNLSARAAAEYLLDKALHYAGGKLIDDVAIIVLKRFKIKK